MLLLLALHFFSRQWGQFYKLFTDITGNSGEDRIKTDEIYTSIVFGILIKCCEVETHFLSETEQNSTPRCRDITFCTEREAAKKSGMRNFEISFLTKRTLLLICIFCPAECNLGRKKYPPPSPLILI